MSEIIETTLKDKNPISSKAFNSFKGYSSKEGLPSLEKDIYSIIRKDQNSFHKKPSLSLKSKKQPPKLTDRDLLLLELLEGYGVLSTQQIRGLIFKDINTRTVLRRLRILKQRGFIYSSEGLPNGSLAWVLSKKSAKIFKQDIELKFINKSSLQHDVAVSGIRIQLERLKIAKSWTAEHVLKKQLISSYSPNESYRDYQTRVSLIPDGLFTTNDNHGGMKTIALELELCLKARHRYKKIFLKYREKKNISFVWYVVLNKSFGELLSRLWDKYALHAWGNCNFAYSTLNEVFREDFKLPQGRKARYRNEEKDLE
ncbi:MAG: replication-relaxation family protein [Oligoflexia bacterium]|nr:replication-relaxation family protein [Oligoflexia bacterium]